MMMVMMVMEGDNECLADDVTHNAFPLLYGGNLWWWW